MKPFSCEEWPRELGRFGLEKRQREPNSNLPVLTERSSGRWSQALRSAAWWEGERQ